MTFEELLFAEQELRKRGYPLFYRKNIGGGIWHLGVRKTPNCWPYTMHERTAWVTIPDDLRFLLFATPNH
jgi:hypothetical protein